MTNQATPSFSSTVSTYTDMCSELPFVHTTQVMSLDKIAQEGYLSPVRCPVFEEELVYLFYGRPSYRVTDQSPSGDSDENTADDYPLYPVCFVFWQRKLETLFKRLFPFDTGASARGRYEPHVKYEAMPGFALEGNIGNAQKLTHLFFGNNTAYLENNPRGDLGQLPIFTQEQGLATLIASRRKLGYYDDRCSAIEAHSHGQINLRDSLMAVVVPQSVYENAALLDAIRSEWKAIPIPYRSEFGDSPSAYCVAIRYLISQLYHMMGVMQ